MCSSTREPGDRPRSPLVAMRRALRRRCRRVPARLDSRGLFPSPVTPQPCHRARVCAMENNTMQFRQLSLAVAVALAPCAAHGAADQAVDLDDVVVTATRTAVTVDQSLAAVEVIDHEQIQRSQATSLPELLRGRAGINLSNQGGAGKLTTLFLRGSESDHVLVLVDGVRIGSSTSGLVAFQDLPLATDRPHRDRARPALQPVRLGSDRRRDPDLHPSQQRRDHAALRAHRRQPRPAPGQRRHRRRQPDTGAAGTASTPPTSAPTASTPAKSPRRRRFPAAASSRRCSPIATVTAIVRCRCAAASTPAMRCTFEGHALRAEGHNDYDGDFATTPTSCSR